MILENYGVRLIRLTEDKIELVRQWRNDPKIQQYMEFRDYITPDMQKKWFQRINNNENYYFIIEYKEKEIGVANIKDIDYVSGLGEPGMYIYDDLYLNSDVPFRAVLSLYDYSFDVLNLKLLKVHILSTNKRAIKFNTALGYKRADNQETVKNQLYFVNRDDYYKKRERIRTLLR